MTEGEYQVWAASPPLPRWWWWRAGLGLAGTTRAQYIAAVEDVVRRDADARGVTLIGDPVTTVSHTWRQVIVTASAMGSGPPGVGDYSEQSPVDVVDRNEEK